MARILSGADFGVVMPQGYNPNFGADLSAQLLGQAMGAIREEATQTRRLENLQTLEKQRNELLSKAEAEKTRLNLLYTEVDRIKNMDHSPAKRAAIAKLGISEFDAGRDGSEFIEALKFSTPDEFNMNLDRLSTKAGTLAQQVDSVLAQNAKKETVYQQGTGDMAGYAFDASTGQYSINPEMQTALMLEAEEKARTEGQLSSKDVVGVNDKVTGLLKDVSKISEAATSLAALEKRGTAAAKLAAVFKFMKAMDPTSTVRESEQGQVYSAEGVMKGFANQLNQMLGEGGLSVEGFADLTGTAKTMANSAIGMADDSVSGYLNVLEDKITVRDMKALQERVPKRFEIRAEMDTGYTPEELRAMTPEQRRRIYERLQNQ